MGILPEDVARVRAASDLVAIAGEHLGLRRVGRRYQALCPFHSEKTPSFSINPSEGLYYCFGCGAAGDVITFVREVEHLEFADAVERLAARAGIPLRYEDASPAAAAERRRLAELREALGRAIDWYHQRLLDGPDAAAARHYLRAERGYDGEVVRAYRLGWAPEGWDTLARALRLAPDVLRDTGLGFVNSAGRAQDGFRGRVLFPIFDARGEPVALGGRSLPGGPGPKYRNSPETALYKKGRVLYGLNWAKGPVVDAGEVVVCEGYTDVIGLHLAGLRHAVATCGTAFGEDHVRALRNFARRFVLAYDADAAGQAAAARVYEWEQRYEIDVTVAALPAGRDPADLARSDPDALRRAVAEAVPMLAFRLDRVLGGADLRSPEGRARAAEAALAVVAEHPSELVRDQYVMRVADRTRIEPDRLRDRLPGLRGRAGRGPAPPEPLRADRARGIHPAEVAVLRIAIHRPDEVAERISEALFEEGEGRQAYLALAGAETLHEAIDGADAATAALLRRLAVEEADAEGGPAVAALVDAAARRALSQLEAEGRAAEIAWLKPTVEALREASTAPEAADRLVRWLSDPSWRRTGRAEEEP